MSRKKTLAVLLTLALCPIAGAAESQIDPKADEVLRRMGEHLAAANQFSFVAEDMMDQVSETGQKIQMSNRRQLKVQRPDRVYAELSGDLDNRRAWYDGKTLTFLDTKEQVYGVIEARDTIDQTLDYIAERFGIVMPMADLIISNPYESAIANVQSAQYVGLHSVDGVACHHLAFRGASADWQIWIEDGEHPLPRKLVITFITHPAQPQYIAFVKDWDLSPQLTSDLFVFQAPEGATKVDFEPILEEKAKGPMSVDKLKPAAEHPQSP